jgi:hypothetical protein
LETVEKESAQQIQEAEVCEACSVCSWLWVLRFANLNLWSAWFAPTFRGQVSIVSATVPTVRVAQRA